MVLGSWMTFSFLTSLLRQSLTMYHGLAWVSGSPCLSLLGAEVTDVHHCIWFSSLSLNLYLHVHWLINHVLLKSHWTWIWTNPYHPCPYRPPGTFSWWLSTDIFNPTCLFYFFDILFFNVSFIFKIFPPSINCIISVKTWEAFTLILILP